MKIYDITQEIFSGVVYPGDVAPTYERTMKIKEDAPCNVTVLNMCVHNATHIDAPYHFLEEGKAIDEMDLYKCIGECTVLAFREQPEISCMEELIKSSEKRLLLKGNVTVTIEVARLLNQYGIQLIGIESQSVGPKEAPMEVHLELLRNEVVILEGIRLAEVPEGNYFLSAVPIKLGESDGAPCRAVLIKND
ncbi:MAG: cyclase family protein [Anaerocolumna sp.]|jgi:arylformamidase|nr:cyclase family protein [Anaerocolumna sp.]